jgi:carbon monoxide dehydrogenase subunit G
VKFDTAFDVAAPLDEVWDALQDVERIAPCMPGAEVLEQTGEDAYKVAVKVRLGPMTMAYRGEVEIVDKDPVTHTATMRAKARETRGQGTASADVRMGLEQRDRTTHASLVTDMQMSGRAAAMGQGVVQDVAATLVETFAHNLEAMVVRGGAPAGAADTAAVGPNGAPSQPAAGRPEPGQPHGPATPREPEAPQELPLGKIAGAVIAGRLRDPRVAGALVLAALGLGVLLGRRSVRC